MRNWLRKYFKYLNPWFYKRRAEAQRLLDQEQAKYNAIIAEHREAYVEYLRTGRIRDLPLAWEGGRVLDGSEPPAGAHRDEEKDRLRREVAAKQRDINSLVRQLKG